VSRVIARTRVSRQRTSMVRRGRRIESARGTRTPSPPPPTTATEITRAQLKARCETAFGGELRITLAVRSREGRGRPHRRKLTAPDVAAHGHRYRAAAFVGQGTATHARRRLAVWDRARSYDHSSLVLPSRCFDSAHRSAFSRYADGELALECARLTRHGGRGSDPRAGPHLRREPAGAADRHGRAGPAPARRRRPVPAGDRDRRRR